MTRFGFLLLCGALAACDAPAPQSSTAAAPDIPVASKQAIFDAAARSCATYVQTGVLDGAALARVGLMPRSSFGQDFYQVRLSGSGLGAVIFNVAFKTESPVPRYDGAPRCLFSGSPKLGIVDVHEQMAAALSAAGFRKTIAAPGGQTWAKGQIIVDQFSPRASSVTVETSVARRAQ